MSTQPNPTQPAPTQPTAAQKLVGDISPRLAELTDQVLFADVWERPGLSKRDRSLATISALIAQRASEQLLPHLKIGLANGLTRNEISELITHLAFYTGWPSAINAIGLARQAFNEHQQ
jgi:4-carboxymuconolactone decarboxylase